MQIKDFMKTEIRAVNQYLHNIKKHGQLFQVFSLKHLVLLRLQVDWEKFLPEKRKDERSHGKADLIFLNAAFVPRGF